MRFASWTPVTLALVGALTFAVACGDDDDGDGDTKAGGGTSSMGGSTAGKGGSAPAEAGATAAEGGAGSGATDSQLCMDLGGPSNLDAVVRGDGKVDAADAFNGFKFGDDRSASVLLNVATDPCIGQHFAHVLVPGNEADLEHLAQCLSLFVQNAAGCAVAYTGAKDSEGRICKSMKAAHAGLVITEEDYAALVMDAARALNAAGVASDSPQFAAVAGALTSDELKADVITDDTAGYSQAGDQCGAGGAGNTAGGGAGGAQ